jgi:hypothetical protein
VGCAESNRACAERSSLSAQAQIPVVNMVSGEKKNVATYLMIKYIYPEDYLTRL